MVILDVAIVNVALPTIQVDLGFSQKNLQWVVSAYALTFGGLLLLGGRAADLLGRRRLFIVGLAIFAAASLLAGLAWSDTILIAARAFQGVGAAVMTPAALSILMTTFREGAERNTALGVWGAVGASGGTVGVLLGGILTDTIGWEWIFFLNVPVALGGDRGRPGAAEREPRRRRSPALRPRGRPVGHGRDRPAGLRAGRGRLGRLGVGPDPGADRRLGRAARALRGDRAAVARARSCRSRSSASGR